MAGTVTETLVKNYAFQCTYSNTPGGCPIKDCRYPHANQGWKKSGKYEKAEADKEPKARKREEVVKVPQRMVGLFTGKEGLAYLTLQEDNSCEEDDQKI